jgi:hypothetical protein
MYLDENGNLTSDVAERLNEFYEVDARKIPGLLGQQMEKEREFFTRPHRSWAESQSLRGIHRLGREPEPTAEDWALGGREDEDSGKLAPSDNPPRVPSRIAGQQMGRNAVSISELIAMNQSAALMSGEAIGAIQEAQNTLAAACGKLSETMNELAAMQGQSTSQLLTEYYHLMQTAERDVQSCREQLENVKGQIAAGQEKGEEFVTRLLG